MTKRHVGLLGGCFNPIHKGHIRLAREMRERLGLERVDLIPCGVPPHKSLQGMLPFELRARLVELALADEEGLEMNPIEGPIPPEELKEGESGRGITYSYDTLVALRQREPDAEFYFLLGANDLLTLPTWYFGLELHEITNLVTVNRAEAMTEDVKLFVDLYWSHVCRPMEHPRAVAAWRFLSGRMLLHMDMEELPLSATAIRLAWLADSEVSDWLPTPVLRELRQRADEVIPVWRQSAE